MKRVAIIGAGISGLRAALEIKVGEVHFFEKSPSVGGRVASRRYEEKVVNHGAMEFNGLALLDNDPEASNFHRELSLRPRATDLPKAMRDALLQRGNVRFFFQNRVREVNREGEVFIEDGVKYFYDQVILTPPIPQIRELLKEDVMPEVEYEKSILFIGQRAGKPVRIELPTFFAERFFERSDDELRALAEAHFGPLQGLDLKKWRYARVRVGVPQTFVRINPRTLLCGDAFDPEGNYHLGAAWRSGASAGRSLYE